jgi:Zn-dependent metalloprotease
LAATFELHGIEAETLEPQRTLFLPLGNIGSSDKQTVRLRQIVGGVPVEGGAVNVLFDAGGRMLSVQTRALPHLSRFDVAPELSPQESAAIAARTFRTEFGVEGAVVREPELVVAQIDREERRGPRLCYTVDVQWHVQGAQPEGGLYFVDARTGAIARRDASIHFVDVGGTVFTKALPGVAPDAPTNPTTNQLAKYARVQSSAGTCSPTRTVCSTSRAPTDRSTAPSTTSARSTTSRTRPAPRTPPRSR